MATLEEKIERLATQPGVYLFKDKKGTIVYVGKAGNLKHRVELLFPEAAEKDTKTLTMVEKIEEIETIVTGHGKRGPDSRKQLDQGPPPSIQCQIKGTTRPIPA